MVDTGKPLPPAGPEPLRRGEGPVPDELLARSAVQKGLTALGPLRECLDLLRAQAPPQREALSAVMLREGVLTRAEVEAAEAAVRSGEVESQLIERYELLVKIGEGGMGAVHAAMDVETLELCALKVLPLELADEEEIVKRFLQEGEVACRLRHPNIVGGIRVGEDEGLHFFSMEFVDGETVYDRLEREGVFPEGESLRIARGAALGLQDAAGHGLVHRDIKPENIMIDHDGTPKLLDLGLVKRIDTSRVTRLTQAGMAIGTPHYISPEQARGEERVDSRSDIYALGATLYHMVTGQVPFEGRSAAVIMTKHLTEELDWPSDVNPQVSEHTSRLISRMMAKERRDRYARPKDVVADIDLILSGRAPSGDMLPPGASSIRQAVKIARARDKAAARARSSAVFERMAKREREGPLFVLTGVMEKHRRIAMAIAGVAGVLLAIAVAALLRGSGRPDAARPPTGRTEGASRPPAGTVDESVAALRSAAVESIPSLLDGLPDRASLSPADARRLDEAVRDCMARLDAEAERRLELALARAKAGAAGSATARDAALAELRELRVLFARSSVRPRIEEAIAALVPGPAPRSLGPAYPRSPAGGRATPEVEGTDLIASEGLRGWRAYGDWRIEGDALVFRYDPADRYSRAIQSQLGFGEFALAAEITTEGGTRAEVAVWEQSTEDRERGAPPSAARAVARGEALDPARGRWAKLAIRADAKGVRVSLGGVELAVRRPPPGGGALHNGRLRFSLADGQWKIRNLKVVPLLAEGGKAYEARFPRGEVPAAGGTRGWSGRPSAEGLRATAAPGRDVGARAVWAGIGGKEPLFTVTGSARLAVLFRAERCLGLVARLKTADGGAYSFRLSGRPPEKQWTALTVPLGDFRAVSADGSPGGAPPREGSRVTALAVGAEGLEGDDAVLVLSRVRVSR